MQKRCLITFLCAAAAPALYAEPLNNTQFTGYFRSTLGLSAGSHMEAFQAPGAAAKYRLGNEADTVLEAALDHRFTPGANAPANSYLQGVFMTSAYAGIGNAADLQFDDVAQAYVKMARYFGDFDLWAGRRYYQRKAVDINDYFWLNTVQNAHIGAGLEDLSVGPGKFDLAVVNYEDAGVKSTLDATQTGTLHSRLVDIRYRDIKLADGFRLNAWIGLAQRPEDKVLGFKARSGQGAALWLDTNIGKSSNELAVFSRQGIAIGGKPIREDSIGTGYDLKKAKVFEVHDAYSLDLDTYNLQFLVLHHTESTGIDGQKGDTITWQSLGVRPSFYLSNLSSLAVELGHDQVKNELTDKNGSVDKATLALNLLKEKNVGARPSLRLFVTKAKWSEDFKGLVASSTYGDKTEGWSSGVQTEVWW